MITDLVIDQVGEILETGKNAVSSGQFLSKSVTCGAGCLLGGKRERISWTPRCHMSHLLTGNIQLPPSMNLKSTRVRRFLSETFLTVSGVGRGQHRRLSSAWGQMPKPEKGGVNTTAAEGELLWLHQVQFSLLTLIPP